MPDNALVISATALQPPDDGKRVVLLGVLRYLLERFGPGNVHYALVGAAASLPIPLPVVVHHLDRPGIAMQLAAMPRIFRRRSYTLQEAMLGSRTIERQVRALVAELDPDVEIYDTIRMGQHAPGEHRPRLRVLYLDDLFSVRYARIHALNEHEEVDIDPLGGFAVNVPGPLRALVRHPAVYLRLLRFERRRLERREAEVVHGFDVSLLVNSDEVELLRRRSGAPNVEALTPMLPEVRAPVRQLVEPPEIVFVGNLGVPHNEDAICSFLRSAMSAVEHRCPGVRLRIIGNNAGETVRRLADEHPRNVVIEGFVENLDEAFARATAVIAPLRFGSGVKIKMLEALARGVPLMATTIAVEGIPLGPDGVDGCVVENDLGRWPELLTGLTDPVENKRMSAAALEFFARTYAVDVVTKQYDGIFELGPPAAH